MTARRTWWRALAALPLLAAAPPPIPIPPIPPGLAATTQAEPIAPMPNRDIDAPTVPSEPGVSLTPSLYGQERFKTGLGYPNGSDAPTELEQRNKLVPGLSLTVPFP